MAEPDKTDLHTITVSVLTLKSVRVVEALILAMFALGLNICFCCSVAGCINCLRLVLQASHLFSFFSLKVTFFTQLLKVSYIIV